MTDKVCNNCKKQKPIYFYGLCKQCYDFDIGASDYYDTEIRQ